MELIYYLLFENDQSYLHLVFMAWCIFWQVFTLHQIRYGNSCSQPEKREARKDVKLSDTDRTALRLFLCCI